MGINTYKETKPKVKLFCPRDIITLLSYTDLYDEDNNKYTCITDVTRICNEKNYLNCSVYRTQSGKWVYITILAGYRGRSEPVNLISNAYLLIGPYDFFERHYFGI